MNKINRSFTWYEVRDADNTNGASYCKGQQYQFTKAEAVGLIKELHNKQEVKHNYQIVKVSHSEKTI